MVAAREFVRCQTEHDVMVAAADAIFQQGYWISVFELEGDQMVARVLRQDPESIRRAEAVYGKRAEEVRFPLAAMKGLDQVFETKRARYSPDIYAIIEQIHTPEVSTIARETLPRVLSSVEAPIFVDGSAFGFISVHGTGLTQNAVPTLELFAQLVSGALENVRHQRAMRERMEQLTALQTELVNRERLAAIGEAAGVLSHEARNPLGAILNALAVLRRNPALDPDGKFVLDIAEEEAFKLDALVRDLMELARPLEPRLRPLNPREIIEAAVSDVRRRFGRGAPLVTVAATATMPEVSADSTLLKLAVENLLRNAALAGAGAPVQVEVAARDGVVVVSVRDTSAASAAAAGAGGDFDPFTMVGARGTGLGLAVVKRAVEAQGGTVRGSMGGACLEIILPVATSAG